MDTIFIHDLRLEARIGVYDWERHLPQTVRLDVELRAPSTRSDRTERSPTRSTTPRSWSG